MIKDRGSGGESGGKRKINNPQNEPKKAKKHPGKCLSFRRKIFDYLPNSFLLNDKDGLDNNRALGCEPGTIDH